MSRVSKSTRTSVLSRVGYYRHAVTPGDEFDTFLHVAWDITDDGQTTTEVTNRRIKQLVPRFKSGLECRQCVGGAPYANTKVYMVPQEFWLKAIGSEEVIPEVLPTLSPTDTEVMTDFAKVMLEFIEREQPRMTVVEVELMDKVQAVLEARK